MLAKLLDAVQFFSSLLDPLLRQLAHKHLHLFMLSCGAIVERKPALQDLQTMLSK
jgi:hypothetical protein